MVLDIGIDVGYGDKYPDRAFRSTLTVLQLIEIL